MNNEQEAQQAAQPMLIMIVATACSSIRCCSTPRLDGAGAVAGAVLGTDHHAAAAGARERAVVGVDGCISRRTSGVFFGDVVRSADFIASDC